MGSAQRSGAAITAHFLVVAIGGLLASAAPVAYISGTHLGADILNLPRMLHGTLLSPSAQPIPSDLAGATDQRHPAMQLPPGGLYVISIGGAGVFDGIFVTSILAPLLTVLQPPGGAQPA